VKNIIQNIVTVGLVISIFLSFSRKNTSNFIDYPQQIVDFTKSEDSREIEKVLDFFQFPLLNYWENENLNRTELKKRYLNYWKTYQYSKNNIQKIDSINTLEYILTTKYEFKRSVESTGNRYRLSEIKFTFNKLGKITSVINISLKKIDNQYIIDHNLINDFSYKKTNLPKNKSQKTPIFLILLLVNLSVQAYFSLNKQNKHVDLELENKKPPKDLKINKEVDGKYSIKYKSGTVISQEELKENKDRLKKINEERELNRLIYEEEKNKKLEKEKIELETRRILAREKAAIELERKKNQEVENRKVEREREAQREKRNKLAREKRAEKKKLEKDKLKKEAAKIKREKLVIKRRQEEDRIQRENEEREFNASNSISNKELDVYNDDVESSEEVEDDFFDNNLSQYVTEIDDDEDEGDDDDEVSDFLTEKYMNEHLKNKLNNK
jgi:hypothetical protein